MAKCINENCGNTAIYDGYCVPCFHVWQQTEAMRNVANDPKYQFGLTDFRPAQSRQRIEEIEWPDDLQDWVF